mmetsp:Transcript_86215/g.279086  ORF Transcript_86215/g.279086 Transcript_86215/m.279086 type:complete len:204 (-) Transcript_86215:1037-1648(-)
MLPCSRWSTFCTAALSFCACGACNVDCSVKPEKTLLGEALATGASLGSGGCTPRPGLGLALGAAGAKPGALSGGALPGRSPKSCRTSVDARSARSPCMGSGACWAVAKASCACGMVASIGSCPACPADCMYIVPGKLSLGSGRVAALCSCSRSSFSWFCAAISANRAKAALSKACGPDCELPASSATSSILFAMFPYWDQQRA